jgi:hypothetical protein
VVCEGVEASMELMARRGTEGSTEMVAHRGGRRWPGRLLIIRFAISFIIIFDLGADSAAIGWDNLVLNTAGQGDVVLNFTRQNHLILDATAAPFTLSFLVLDVVPHISTRAVGSVRRLDLAWSLDLPLPEELEGERIALGFTSGITTVGSPRWAQWSAQGPPASSIFYF